MFICFLFSAWKAEISGKSLQWSYNERNGVSNHRRLDCLFNRLFRRRSKKTSKLHVTGLCEGNAFSALLALCEGNPPEASGFPPQRASNAKIVSIWWRHHVFWTYPFSRTTPLPIHWIIMDDDYGQRDDVITWKQFHVSDPLWGESISHRRIPHMKGQ